MFRFALATSLAAMMLPVIGHADHVEELEAIDVAAERSERAGRITLEAENVPQSAPDTASILKRMPGANVNYNGPLTGIAQYRGMFSDRINVQVDGVSLISGGPNAMDTPLSYIPRSRLESIEVYRGIAPVSSGTETLGGTIKAESRLSKFTASKELQFHGDAVGGAQSVYDGYSLTGLASMANRNHRMHVAVTRDAGEHADMPLALGTLKIGTDGKLANHDADIFDPDSAMFFVNNFNGVSRDLYSIFSEWTGSLTERLQLQTGIRYTHVEMDAGTVDGTPAQMMMAAGTLRDGFNSADRSQSDDNVDISAQFNYELNDDLSVLAGAARKTRSPSYQERYLWLPLQATGGLADGNNYVGDVNLDPEVSYEAELGFDWRQGQYYFAPRIFYRHVDDYIQGTPATDPATIMVSSMMTGDPTPLKFSNVDARLYGFDVEGGMQLTERWFVDGVVSYVRGERRDIDDDLYRIAPLNGTVALSHRRANWSATVEGQFYAEQDHVSRTNGETSTGGYGLLNVYGQYSIPEQGITITAGIDNLFDKQYRPHLAGINRVINSDVATGTRLPGDGINGYLRLAIHW